MGKKNLESRGLAVQMKVEAQELPITSCASATLGGRAAGSDSSTDPALTALPNRIFIYSSQVLSPFPSNNKLLGVQKVCKWLEMILPR